MDKIDKKKQFLNDVLPIIEEIIREDFSVQERSEWVKCLNYLKTDITSICGVLFDALVNINSNPDSLFPFDFSNSNIQKFEPHIEYLFIGVLNNSAMKSNFGILLHRIIIIFQSKVYNVFQATNTQQNIRESYLHMKMDIALNAQRFGLPNELPTTNYPSFRTFHINKDKTKFNITSLRIALQSNNEFLNSNIDNDAFEMIFSLKKINSKFNKISWLGSIVELKFFIKELVAQGIIFDDPNYYYTIIDCFKNGEIDILLNQLGSPSGSKRNFIKIKEIVAKSHQNI